MNNNEICYVVITLILLCIIFYGLCSKKIRRLIKSSSSRKLKQSFTIEQDLKPVKVHLYYSENCGYCHKFLPVWEDLKRAYGKKLSFIDINITNPNNITIYPKIKIKIQDVTRVPSLFIETPQNYYPYEFNSNDELYQHLDKLV